METKEDNQKKVDLGINKEYFEWLKSFTEDKGGFYDDDWLYFPEELSELDRKNVAKLSLFYNCIDDYASKHNIDSIPCEFGRFYRIKFGDYGFEIGTLEGQGIVTFCEKTEVNNEIDFIDFNDILNHDKKNLVETIELLKSLKELVTTNPQEFEKNAIKNLRKRYNIN